MKGLSLKIGSGEKVAIVGGSGAGKSTIARLMFRFYDPDSGQVTINGQDLRNCKISDIRSHIGVVPQDCVLFNDTIYENIRYGNLNATQSEIEIAAKAADLHDSIEQMADKYETIVGERGTKLSGGEKQRLAIARCTLKNPDVVIYDEATSSLDSMTEKVVACSAASSLFNSENNGSTDLSDEK